MRKILSALFLLCLAALPAQAQFLPLLGAGGKIGGGTPGPPSGGYVGPGDVVSGALLFVGLRAYTTAIANAATQPLVRVRRASDSHACDLTVATGGGVGNTANCSTGGDNGATAASFCNATSCFATVWYDQSGNGNDLPQTDTTMQPLLVFNCLGSKPCLSADGVNDWMGGQPSPGSAAGAYTWSSVVRSDNQAGVFFALGTSQATDVEHTASANIIQAWDLFVAVAGQAAMTDNVWHTVGSVENTTVSANLVVDGNSNPWIPFANFGFGPGSYGAFASGNGGAPCLCDMVEIGEWDSALSTQQLSSLCHNQFVYWATPTSC